MKEWPGPHNSVHSAGYVPILFGVTRRIVVIPGTASSFSAKLGTKKLCTTSSEWSLKTIGLPFGT